jgi:hypothetical protein
MGGRSIMKVERLTRETIKHFEFCFCELRDNDGELYTGYLVIRDKEYIILPMPLHPHYSSFHFKFSHIRSIKFMSNGYEIKK